MDYFASQDAARKKTGLLVAYFVLAVAGIALAVYALVVVFLALSTNAPARFDLPSLLATTGGVLLIVCFGSFYKMMALRAGGAQVAERLGGRIVPSNTREFNERRLLNVVEEMAIASGVPIPPVYLLDEELGINAFAAGFTGEDAAIGITRGAVAHLNREELQGVLAHEFSHILNGDMRLNIRLLGLVHGILVIALAGRVLLRGMGRGRVSRGRDQGRGGLSLLVLGLGLLVVGSVGVFFGRLIKSAVSRQREYLADASAVQFTRNPPGLAGALKKIGGLTQGSRLQHPRVEEASHMLFGNGLHRSWFALMATHPPLDVRIRRLEPRFNGMYPQVHAGVVHSGTHARLEGGATPTPFLPPPLPNDLLAAGLAAASEATGHVIDGVGDASAEAIAAAHAIIEGIPVAVRDASRDPYTARAVVCALMLDPTSEQVRTRQWQLLQQTMPSDVYRYIERVVPMLDSLEPIARLPLIDLAASALRALSPEQYKAFRSLIEQLIAADRAVNLFEYAVQHVLVRRLEVSLRPCQARYRAKSDARSRSSDLACVLSTLARVGHCGSDEARVAFERGASTLRSKGVPVDPYAEDTQGLEGFDQALQRLVHVPPMPKKDVLHACLACMVSDQAITAEEADLFRCVALTLDCPLPPWLVLRSPEADPRMR